MPNKPAKRPAILDDPELVRKGALRSYRDGRMRKIFLDSVLAYQATLSAQKPTPRPKRREHQGR